MIPLSLAEVAQLCPGRLDAAPWADEITGVQIDSRRIEEGDLFVAVGRGADFARHARARGAAATLVPDDAFAALAALGRTVRERSGAQVVGITGSTGKTSTKDLLAALCRPHASVVSAERSYNNELGVPLTLCRLEPETDVCVVELAMRGLGQIAELATTAKPGIGVITTIGPAHLELVGSVAGVAQAKAELVAALPPGGTAVVPAGATELEPYLTRADIELVRFGPGGDVTLERFEVLDGRAVVTADVVGERVELELNLTAPHHASNALAALAAYRALGLPLERADLGAGDVELSRWRGEELALPGDGVLINDCYNANPVSMRAALLHLALRSGGRRSVAVLGDMAELGAEAPRYHREIGALAAELGVGALVAVGPLARGYLDERIPDRRWTASAEEAREIVAGIVVPGDSVLVKGSRSIGLEAVSEALAGVVA
ncbi:MAG: UDP-N-acetylmuramoyl-tripeptide--D-alanyl-D-alanine ligase [Actinomycetota bacterium]|nr:UDP-N-acetylmuramoyl-tripeptide--D-alanyl-D-alanine ligase [Actinomycetota bacterium]